MMSKRAYPDSVWYRRFGKRWLPLENASKIFLATYSTVDTKVYRYTAVLYEKVDSLKLQRATERAFDYFDLYRAILRRGIFWYYLEESNLRPKVQYEADVPCALLYTHDYQGLLFRALYRENRIHLEVFHALSDGNGALRFFRGILKSYFDESLNIDSIMSPLQHRDQMMDAFSHRLKYQKSEKLLDIGKKTIINRKEKSFPIYHIKDILTLDGRMRVTEMQCKTKSIITCAKAYKSTITVFLTAIFIQSIIEHMPQKYKDKNSVVSISVPVDLRRFFPSETARNFFATILVSYGSNEDQSLLAICESLTKQFEEKITPEKMEEKIKKLVSLETSFALRWVPRPVKDAVLKIANYVNNKKITASMTNTGQLLLGEPFDEKVYSAGIMSSAIRPQFSVMSHKDIFTITFTSPFVSDDIQNSFYNRLEEQGISVKVYGNIVYGKNAKGTLQVDHSVYPDVSPRYDSISAFQWLLSISIILISLEKIINNAIPWFDLSLRFILLIIAGMWGVVLAILRKKRNPNKVLLYQVGIFEGLTLLWDLFSGWTGWSLNYALPIITITSIIAALIAARVSSLKIGDTLLYLQGVALIGLIPFIISVLGWVQPVWPSIVASTFSLLVFLYTLIKYWKELKIEVLKKFHM